MMRGEALTMALGENRIKSNAVARCGLVSRLRAGPASTNQSPSRANTLLQPGRPGALRAALNAIKVGAHHEQSREAQALY